MRVLTEMMDRGICLNVATFNTLVDALCKEGMATEAHELLDVMIQRGAAIWPKDFSMRWLVKD